MINIVNDRENDIYALTDNTKNSCANAQEFFYALIQTVYGKRCAILTSGVTQTATLPTNRAGDDPMILWCNM
ncbi:MAG: hypothetical protein IJJ76_06455 [Ruminococcus sp.]|uniref:hypothetical protein n=1 Tax=Ruminococcus sp. TaxID=41978 RepID=UPI0025EC4843|nr:hypothetical protein [Ruminococcus sp.]MBR0529391.1 hypothetical protein [Ruminococcus sp.]